MDLALNNLQRLISHKTKQTKPNYIYSYSYFQRSITIIFTTISLFVCNNKNLLAYIYMLSSIPTEF